MVSATPQVFQYFVAHKIKSLKWCPFSNNDNRESPIVVTGSYDDESNRIAFFRFSTVEQQMPSSTDVLADDTNTTGSASVQQRLRTISVDFGKLGKHQHKGDVTGIQCFKFGNEMQIVSSSSTGSVLMYSAEFSEEEGVRMKEIAKWEKLHQGPATSLDISERTLTAVVAGEDGKINLISLQRQDAQQRNLTINGDSLPINCIKFTSALSDSSFISASTAMKVWDIRQSRDTPVQIIKDEAFSNVVINSVAIHETQPNKIASGASNGIVNVWDLKYPNAPIEKIEHFYNNNDRVWQVGFHPEFPQNLLCCSESGAFIRCDFDRPKTIPMPLPSVPSSASAIPSYSRDGRLSLLSQAALSINAFDINKENGLIVFGADNESLSLRATL